VRIGKIASLLAAVTLVGCGSSAVSSKQMVEATSAIRAAEELGARSYPRAALHLKMAEDQKRIADALIRDGEGDEATAVLARAEADAELAVTLAREARLRAQAREANSRLRALQQSAAAGE
jgi:hypothetical protein